jgi:hypothetical protein
VPRNDEHPDYRDCRWIDPDCPRFPCRVYREGYEDGHRDGYAAGYADGEASGFASGYAAGMAAVASAGLLAMLTLSLIIIGVLLTGIVVVTVSPTRKCRRCHGERVTRHRWTGKIIRCPRCDGRGRHPRFGAAVVHRMRRAIRDELREQREQRERNRNEVPR